MASVYQALGQYNEAKDYYEKALIIRKKIFGEEHADVAASYNNLGIAYQDLGQYNKANDYHEKALLIRKTICGEEHKAKAVASSPHAEGISGEEIFQVSTSDGDSYLRQRNQTNMNYFIYISQFVFCCRK